MDSVSSPRPDCTVADVYKADKHALPDPLINPRIPKMWSHEGTVGHTRGTGVGHLPEDLKVPGGFRRGFLHTKAEELGEQRPRWRQRLMISSDPVAMAFAQQELWQEGIFGTPLVGVRQTIGTKTLVIGILKSMVGPATLYLPQAFANCGLVFAVVTLPVIGYFTWWCAMRLVYCRQRVDAHLTYSGVLEQAFGSLGKTVADVSLLLCQCSFCISYMIFITHMLKPMFPAELPVLALVFMQLPILVPLSWIRSVASLSFTNVLANLLILCALLSIYWVMGSNVVEFGSHEGVVSLRGMWPIYMGTAIFVFEGIGLVLPLYEVYDHPQQFGSVFGICIAIATGIFFATGLLGYLTYGPRVDTIVLLSIAVPDPKVGSLTEVLYCIALLCTFPFQLLPATRILERKMFGSNHSSKQLVGQPPQREAVLRSSFRTCVVVALALCAFALESHFEHFVSLVGALCCIPLAFVYPCFAHAAIVGPEDKWVFFRDCLMGTVGLGLAVFSLAENIIHWE